MLIFGGIALAAVGMLYGLYYAVFVEHQTLDSIGGSLAASFVHAAEGRLPEAHEAIDAYAAVKCKYVRRVDVHSHWVGLAMLMIVMGIRQGEFQRARTSLDRDRVPGRLCGFSAWSDLRDRQPWWSFPIGVSGRWVSALVTVALLAVAVGFAGQNV